MGSIESLIQRIKNEHVQMVDLRFVDLFGIWHHLTLPASQVGPKLFERGIPFDGSSVPGFKSVQAGDMVLVPDPSTALLDPFWDQTTLGMICNVAEAGTMTPFGNDPRTVAIRAERLLSSLKIAERSLWGGDYPKAGFVRSFMCPQCGRIILYGAANPH